MKKLTVLYTRLYGRIWSLVIMTVLLEAAVPLEIQFLQCGGITEKTVRPKFMVCMQRPYPAGKEPLDGSCKIRPTARVFCSP